MSQKNMMTHFVREKLKTSDAVHGIWSILPFPALTEIAALSGFDFQIFDMEHGAYDFASLEAAIRTCEQNNCSPFVRINGMDAVATQRALDFGSHGVIFPQAKDNTDSRRVVQYTKYPPQGTRGYNPFTRTNNYGINSDLPHRNHNAFAMAGVIIENRSAAQDLDKILEIEDLELVYIGAYDMSVAMGKPGDMSNPELIQFIESCLVKIRKANKVAGVMVKNPEETKRYTSLGANFILLGVDSNLIGNSLKDTRKRLEKN